MDEAATASIAHSKNGLYGQNGWELWEALDISNDGNTIVGYGRNSDGNLEAWAANISPVPEPSTIILLGTGLLGLAGASRKRFLRK